MIKLDELLSKVEDMKKSGSYDLSTEEDLAIATMHLISLEEHTYFNAQKTGKDAYYDAMMELREMRKELLSKMVPRHEGETWCTCKHLLGLTMRLIEVGVKLRGDGRKDEAQEFFDRAYKTFGIFWGLRLKLIELPDVKEMAKEEKPMTLNDIVTKLVDCCNE
jgi:hypothetical protein